MKAAVTIEGEDYGEIELKPFFAGAALYNPEGAHFFCPTCGRVWAQIVPTCGRHNVYTLECREHHRNHYCPGGSIWLPLHPEITHAYNQAILRYETLRHCDLAEEAGARDLPLPAILLPP